MGRAIDNTVSIPTVSYYRSLGPEVHLNLCEIVTCIGQPSIALFDVNAIVLKIQTKTGLTDRLHSFKLKTKVKSLSEKNLEL